MIYLRTLMNWIIFITVMLLSHTVWAQSTSGSDQTPLQVVNSYSDQSLQMAKGPIANILAAIVLIAGVGGLLRGHHRMAVACGIAFIVVLFLKNLS